MKIIINISDDLRDRRCGETLKQIMQTLNDMFDDFEVFE